MKSRFFLVVSVVLFVVSCSQFVNLGDKSSDGEDNTEGLPDEIYEGDNADTASAGNYDDWNEDNADSGYYDEDGQDKYEENDEQNAPYPDEDYADSIDPTDTDTDIDTDSEPDMNDPANPDDFPDEDAPVYIFPESDPFPEGFTNVECGCGSTPDYFPVCCDGKILVFNPCFVNCYAINSGGKICSVSEPGLCDEAGITRDLTEGDGDDADPSVGEDDDSDETDNDTELPDEDADSDEIPNECGCYPEDEASVFSCGETRYFITECLANCFCENPEKIF